jgi:hypothetical protein
MRGWMVLKGVHSVSISEVVDAIQLSTFKVWIAGLLCDFELYQAKEFYSLEGLILNSKILMVALLLNEPFSRETENFC